MDAEALRLFLEALYQRRATGIKLGLDTVSALLEALGRPQDELAVIHIAGTNGKGSVAAMLDGILRQAGYRTGRYTSPHLVAFNERFCIDGEAIANDVLAGLLEDVDVASNRVAEDPAFRQPTFFEFATAVAMLHFQRSGANLAILETGLGGRLDATNVVNPLVSVITSIGIDHAEFLGPDLVQIAREKAGIIKPGRPVVCGVLDPEARTEIRRIAQERSAPWIDATEEVAVQRISEDLGGQKIRVETAGGGYPPILLPMLGAYQLQNAGTTVATVEALEAYSPLGIGRDAIRDGLGSAHWPGRAQVLNREPPVLLDAAHNPAGARALRVTLRELFQERPLALVVGMARDKDAAEFMQIMAPCARRCWSVALANPRSADPAMLARLSASAGTDCEVGPLKDAVTAAVAWARESGGVVCICGSIYLAGEVLEGSLFDARSHPD